MLKKEREKQYGDVLSLMLNDTLETEKEARENLAVAREQEKNAESELKRLNNSVEKNHRGFLRVIKDLLIMLFKKPKVPSELERALKPVNTYLQALKAIPKAEANLAFAKDEHAKAKKACTDVESTLNLIKKLREKYPHENE